MLLFFDLLFDYYFHECCTTCADFWLYDMTCANIYIYKYIEYTHVNMIPCVKLRYKISYKQVFLLKGKPHEYLMIIVNIYSYNFNE